MLPNQLAKNNSESAHQIALFAWAARAYILGFDGANMWSNGESVACDPNMPPKVPELKWLHHIPNGGSRGDSVRSQQIRGAKLKAEGVREGVSDLSLPVRRGPYSGLYIEMKKPDLKPKRQGSKGGCSDEQIEFGTFVKEQGFCFGVCYSWEEARDAIVWYLKQGV